jgi:hypothetical protein
MRILAAAMPPGEGLSVHIGQEAVWTPGAVQTRVGQPNTSRGPNLIYRTPSGARYSVSFRRVVIFQDMNAVVRKQFELSNSVRTYTVNCKML